LERQQRLQEVLRGIAQLFKRLRLCWDKATEAPQQQDAPPAIAVEDLVPYRDENGILQQKDLRTELERKRGGSYVKKVIYKMLFQT